MGEGHIPVTEDSIDSSPMPYLQLLHEALGNINAALLVLDDAPAAFNLVPQASVENALIKVGICCTPCQIK